MFIVDLDLDLDLELSLDLDLVCDLDDLEDLDDLDDLEDLDDLDNLDLLGFLLLLDCQPGCSDRRTQGVSWHLLFCETPGNLARLSCALQSGISILMMTTMMMSLA